MHHRNILTQTLAIVSLLAIISSAHAGPTDPAKPISVTTTLVYPNGKPATDATLILDLIDMATNAVTTTSYKPDATGSVTFTLDRAKLRASRSIAYVASPTGVGFLPGRANASTTTVQPFTSVHIHLVDSKGIPIPHALVYPKFLKSENAFSWWNKAVPGAWNQITDSNGDATFSKLPQGFALALSVDDDHYAALGANSNIQLANTATTPDATLQLDPASTISGTVLYDQTNKPAAGVLVSAQATINPTPELAPPGSFGQTDSNGRYTLTKLGPGTYSVTAEQSTDSKEWVVRPIVVHLGSGDNSKGDDLTFIRGGVIAGKVTDKTTGAPVPNVNVMANAENSRAYFMGITGLDGTYSFHVVPGGLSVDPTIPNGYNSPTAWKEVQVANGETKTVNFQIEAPVEPTPVHGVVRDMQDKPVPGAEVTVILSRVEHTGQAVKTDSQGRFTLDRPGLEPQDAVVAKASGPSGYLATPSAASYASGNNLTLHVAPNAFCTLKGLVTDNSGNPVPNIRVDLYCFTPEFGISVDYTQCDSQGRYVFPHTYAGLKYNIECNATGYLRGYSSNVSPTAGQTLQVPPLVIKAAGSFIGGTLLDVHGQPIAGATISDNYRPEVKTTTDQAGHFMLKGLADGQVVLTIQAEDGRSDYPQINSGRGDYTFYLASPVTGIVLGPDGKPVPGAKVDAGIAQAFTTDATGQFIMDSPGLKPKAALLARFGNLSTQTPFIYNGEAKITLRLSEGGLCTITGQIKDTDGNPIPNAALKLDRFSAQVGGQIEEATTDSSGRYAFAPVYGNSHYLIQSEAPGYGNGSSAEFITGTTQTVQVPNITMAIADAFVGGTVVDAKGTPVPNAQVTDQDLPTYPNTTTDQAGHFLLKGVPRGKTEVGVVAPDGSNSGKTLTSNRADNIIYLEKPNSKK